MDGSFDSTDRRPVEYVLFALGFISSMVFMGGVILTCPPLAFAGFGVQLLTVWGSRNLTGDA